MIGRMIAPPAQMMLLAGPKSKFLRFEMVVDRIALKVSLAEARVKAKKEKNDKC